MNILQVVSSSRLSGAEKHVVVLAERLLQRGHKVWVACPPGGWVPEQLRGIQAEVLERRMHGVHFAPAAADLAKTARQLNIDLVHAHLTCASYHAYLLGKRTGLPVVSSVHVRSRDYVYRKLLPQAKNHIITVSEWVREGFLEQGVPPNHVHTIYNGTEFLTDAEVADPLLPSSFTHDDLPIRAEFSLPPDAELIGIFARVDDFKGHPLLIQAARRVVNARPKAYFVCVGAVEPRIQKALWEMAASDGVAERIRFTGIRNDVRRIMAEMDVSTLPSRYEACSMAIIEAMAMGKPVIATRAGGNPELIIDQETGVLIERKTDALADAIISLLANKEHRLKMGEAARICALERFSAKAMVDNIERLYRQLLLAP